MFYTGAPQKYEAERNRRIKYRSCMGIYERARIQEIIVHAPYIINLGNAVKPETFSLAVEFLAKEIDRTVSCRSHTLILHPGAHVGEGVSIGTEQIIKRTKRSSYAGYGLLCGVRNNGGERIGDRSYV